MTENTAETTVTVYAENGLHARPVTSLLRLREEFATSYNTKLFMKAYSCSGPLDGAEGKVCEPPEELNSPISFVTKKIKKTGQLRIFAQGPKAQQAIEAIEIAFAQENATSLNTTGGRGEEAALSDYLKNLAAQDQDDRPLPIELREKIIMESSDNSIIVTVHAQGGMHCAPVMAMCSVIMHFYDKFETAIKLSNHTKVGPLPARKPFKSFTELKNVEVMREEAQFPYMYAIKQGAQMRFVADGPYAKQALVTLDFLFSADNAVPFSGISRGNHASAGKLAMDILSPGLKECLERQGVLHK